MKNILPTTKTPYQGLNRILGDLGGFRRGEMVLISSLENNYSDNLLHDLYLGCGLYNTPQLLDNTKTPLVLNLTLCDESIDDIGILNQRVETALGEVEFDKQEILSQRGFTYKTIQCHNQKDITLGRLIELISTYLTDYEIHMLTIGDLTKINNLDEENNPQTLREMYSRLRGFFNPLGTIVVTTGTLSKDTELLRRINPDGYLYHATLRDMRGGVHLDQTMEVDTHLLTSVQDDTVTMHCAKHRGTTASYGHLRTQYRFAGNNGLLFDADKGDSLGIVKPITR